jgi:hypothetical protein
MKHMIEVMMSVVVLVKYMVEKVPVVLVVE